MKKILLILLLIASHNSYTQSQFTVSAYGGYSIPLADLKEDFPQTLTNGRIDFVNAKTYLLKSGFNFGAGLRWVIDTASQIRITGGFSYNGFAQSKEYTMSSSLTPRKITNKMGILTVSAGAQYDITPKKNLNPYIGLELTGNFYSGTIETTGDTLFILDRKPDKRFGVNVNAGVEYKLSKRAGIILGAKYCFANLIGKKKDTQTTTSGQTDTGEEGVQITGEIGLNDEDPATAKSKSINFVQIYTGLSIYFGKR